jgi:hypothetical protein
VLDVRNTLEVRERAIVDARLTGGRDLGADGEERFLRGELPPTVALRVSARFLTAHPDFAWLNRLHCLAVGSSSIPRTRGSAGTSTPFANRKALVRAASWLPPGALSTLPPVR